MGIARVFKIFWKEWKHMNLKNTSFNELIITDCQITRKGILCQATYPLWHHHFEFLILHNGLVKAKTATGDWCLLSNSASSLISLKAYRALA